MRKRRTREHIIADLSANHVERCFLLCGHTVQRVDFDYGYDLYVQTFNEEGFVENGFCLLQLKATGNVSWITSGAECSLLLERRDIEMWQREQLPVFVVLYDAAHDRAYWIDIQAMEVPAQTEMSATVTIRIPATQSLSETAVRQMQDRKNRVILRERGEHDTER